MKKLLQSLSPVFLVANILFAQNNYYTVEKPQISGGAEMSTLIERAINNGYASNFIFNNVIPNDLPYDTPNAIPTIDGINFDEDAANSGYYNIPPDPMGAAGPNNLVSVVNTSIEWFTKAGVQQSSKRLGKNLSNATGSFFESLNPLTGTFDPKVIYDQYNSRFLVVALEKTTSPSNTSRILLAVSKTSDPNSGWWFHEINSEIGSSWADYPGFAVGTDAVFITCNLFTFSSNTYTGSRLWIVEKGDGSGGFYDGSAVTDYIYDPASSVSQASTTMQPAHMFGTAPTGVITYLVRYSGYSTGTNELLSIITVSGTLSSASFSHTSVSVSDIDNTSATMPNAPQFGTSTSIETNDRRTLNAVWRNNYLWATTTVVPPSGTDAGETTAYWFKISADGVSALSSSDGGFIGGEDIAANAYTFFPSIAVNSSGDMVIGFSVSASSIFPGFYYTGRLSTDPAGTTITPGEVRAGLDYYVRIFSGTSNRWGDYSGASVDPSDDQTFYVFNEYALSRGTPVGTGLGRWGTVFGKIGVSALPVELSSFSFNIINDGIKLNWVTETEVNNYGFEIERIMTNDLMTNDENGQQSLVTGHWVAIGFVEGNGNSNSPKYYSFIDRGINYGSFTYRLKQIDNDGTYEYSEPIEVYVAEIPGGFVLEQNYPNPFNPGTKIKFAVDESTNATLKIYDILGNEIITLFNEITEAGKVYELEFNASELPAGRQGLSSGVYYYRLSTPKKSLVRKMLLLQ